MATIRRSSREHVRFRWVLSALCVLSASATAAPRTADNAALLYYQAFMRCPSLDSFPVEAQSAVFKGTATARDVRKYVDESRDVIQFVEAGSQVSRCDWAIPAQQAGNVESSMILRMKTVLFLVGADAQVLAEGGSYRKAFERLMTLRRLAAHVTNDPNLCGQIPLLVEETAVNLISRIMDTMPPDREVLTWLRSQLPYEAAVYEGLTKALWADHKQTLLFLQTDKQVLSRLRQIVPTNSTEAWKAQMKTWDKLSDGELIRLVAEMHAEFLNEVAAVLAADMPYGQKRTRLDDLVTGLEKASRDNPAVIWDWIAQARTVVARYDASVGARAKFNALRAALEVYLATVESRQTPETLVQGVPTDPFSGRDFEYEKTASGFILRCRNKPADRSQPWEFKFTVRGKD